VLDLVALKQSTINSHRLCATSALDRLLTVEITVWGMIGDAERVKLQAVSPSSSKAIDNDSVSMDINPTFNRI
jgi:hypothetical protein